MGFQGRSWELPRELRLFNEIKATVSGFFTTRHHFATEAGVIEEFALEAFPPNASFREVGGRELLVKKAIG